MTRLVFLLAFAAPLFAEIQPSFLLDNCAWKATDVVVASEGETVDGTFDVVEVWKGAMHVGDHVTVPGLEAFASEEHRRVAPSWVRDDESAPFVTGKEVILFLGTGEEARLSAAWIENGRAYAFLQEINPGPTQLTSLGKSAEELEDEVRAIVDVQRRFRDAESGKEIVALMRAGIVRHQMVAELGERGAGATPALLAIVDDEALASMHQFALTALVKAAGRDAIPHLIRVLERELAWFVRHDPDPESRARNEHYGIVYVALSHLHDMFAPEGRAIAEKWSEYWGVRPDGDQLTNRLHDYLRDIPL